MEIRNSQVEMEQLSLFPEELTSSLEERRARASVWPEKEKDLTEPADLQEPLLNFLALCSPGGSSGKNVPGCLSSRNKQTGIYDFNFLLAAFAEVGYSCGWKIYDAQYCRVDGYPRAIPQRRRRVFVVGHLGAEWQYPAEVLFEPHSLSGNTPPRRVKGQGTAADAQRCLGTARRLGDAS